MGLTSEEVTKTIENPSTTTPSEPSSGAPDLSTENTSSEPTPTPDPALSSEAEEQPEKANTSSQEVTAATESPENQERTARNTLGELAMTFLSQQLSTASREVFQSPRAFSRIPEEDRPAIMYGGTIGFLGIQVALLRKQTPADFEAAGGMEGLMKKIEAKANEYGKAVDAELEKQAKRRAADAARKGAAREQTLVQ